MDPRVAFTINSVTFIAGVVTIIWFFRDMRRENGKLLREVTQIQKDHTQLFNEIIQSLKK